MKIETKILDFCPVCDSKKVKKIMSGEDFESHTGNYDIYKCIACGIGFTNPQPLDVELKKLYDDRSSSDFPDTHKLVEKMRGSRINGMIQHLFSKYQLNNANVLDFGCGDGFATVKLSEFPKCERIVAVDFHSSPPPLLQNADPTKVTYQNLFSFKVENEKFDLVFCRHVLEHVHAPSDFLQMLKSKMKPGGILFIELPNFNTVWRKIFGKYFYGLYLPRHLYHFSSDSLDHLLQKNGFEILESLKGETPVLPGTLKYLTGIPFKNLGLIGIILFPLQILFDKLTGGSSTLISYSRNNA